MYSPKDCVEYAVTQGLCRVILFTIAICNVLVSVDGFVPMQVARSPLQLRESRHNLVSDPVS